MHTRILTFHELRLPHLDGDRKGQWVTYSKIDGMVYLLNEGRCELADLMEIDTSKDIRFDTEAACHAAASQYYMSHGYPYPHTREWRRAILVVPKIVDDDNESQVMRFK